MRIYILFLLIFLATGGQAQNVSNDSYIHAKRMLEGNVYFDHPHTLYCDAVFDMDKNITLPKGFETTQYKSRAHRMEWEHIVAAENFGRTFDAWRDGDKICVNASGEPYKGRKCAEKVSKEYRLMQADMYNLYPAVGAVNAARRNYRFTELDSNVPSAFGSCLMKIDGRSVEPPARARGIIARTHLYMQDVYPSFHLSHAQQQLMTAWDKAYPVDAWECQRTRRIEVLQKNENKRVKDACLKRGLW